jgi:exodeoxyribonuclease VII small subunit
MGDIENNNKSFEVMMNELHTIVTNMENSEAELDSIVSNYTKGVGLLTQCRNKLAEAELSINELTERLEKTEKQNNDSR